MLESFFFIDSFILYDTYEYDYSTFYFHVYLSFYLICTVSEWAQTYYLVIALSVCILCVLYKSTYTSIDFKVTKDYLFLRIPASRYWVKISRTLKLIREWFHLQATCHAPRCVLWSRAHSHQRPPLLRSESCRRSRPATFSPEISRSAHFSIRLFQVRGSYLISSYKWFDHRSINFNQFELVKSYLIGIQ